MIDYSDMGSSMPCASSRRRQRTACGPLPAPGCTRSSSREVMIDEYQDSNLVQEA